MLSLLVQIENHMGILNYIIIGSSYVRCRKCILLEKLEYCQCHHHPHHLCVLCIVHPFVLWKSVTMTTWEIFCKIKGYSEWSVAGRNHKGLGGHFVINGLKMICDNQRNIICESMMHINVHLIGFIIQAPIYSYIGAACYCNSKICIEVCVCN